VACVQATPRLVGGLSAHRRRSLLLAAMFCRFALELAEGPRAADVLDIAVHLSAAASRRWPSGF
jgi:hypothetical protein